MIISKQKLEEILRKKVQKILKQKGENCHLSINIDDDNDDKLIKYYFNNDDLI
jgi:hypothetical protein